MGAHAKRGHDTWVKRFAAWYLRLIAIALPLGLGRAWWRMAETVHVARSNTPSGAGEA